MTVTVADVVAYIGGPNAAATWADPDTDPVTYTRIADALAAESAAQLMRVTYPVESGVTDYPDLDEALKRRVQRNLSMRSLPQAIDTTTGDAIRIGGTDPEIRRLEAPYRVRTMG